MTPSTLPRGTALSQGSALALLILLLIGAYAIGVKPWLSWLEGYRGDVLEAQQVLAKLASVEERVSLPALADLKDAPTLLRELTLAAPSEAQASAALQDMVKSAVDGSGAALASVAALPAAHKGALTGIALRVQLVADTASLQRLLYRLEAGQPALILDNLQLRALTGSGVASGHNLEVQLDVAGFAVPGARP